MVRVTCQGCGVEFHRNRKPKDARKYCSRACAFANQKQWRPHRARPKMQKAQQYCLHCGADVGVEYLPKYCSSRCKWEALKKRQPGVLEKYRKRSALKYQATRGCAAPRSCPFCKVEFVPARNDGRQRFCSSTCANRWNSRLYSNAEHRARHWHVEYERGISWRALVERDGDTCSLCGEPVELTKDRRNRLGPTVDHRIPMSRGGAHVWSNVQLAHRACNSSKGAAA